MNANLHHLQLFYYVAKAKGISPAVKIIPYGIQQPAVSQQLIQLEEDLGIVLFRRRPFELTPAGEKLFKFVSKFFDNLDSELLAVKDDSGVRVRFGCPSVISSNYFPELVSIIVRKYPAMRPHVSELDGYKPFISLINREIDVSLSFGNPPRSKSVVVHDVVSIPLCIVLPKEHRFLKDGFWPKSDFAKEKWIAVQEQSGGTQELREGLIQFGVTPEFSASTNSIEAALKYVEMGLGIALMAQPPSEILKPYDVELLPQSDIFGEVTLSLAWHKDCLLDEKMLQYILDSARNLSRKYVGT